MRLPIKKLLEDGYREIGNGQFTRAFMSENDGMIYLYSSDPIKETMAHGWFPDSDLFPDIELIDHDIFQYRMEFYETMKGRINKKWLDEDNLHLYCELKRIQQYINIDYHNRDCYDLHMEAINMLNIQVNHIDDILEAYNQAVACEPNSKYKTCTEFVDRNMATKNGKLILMDCFFHVLR